MKVALAGYYGFSNVGDELLLKVALDGMRARLPEAQAVVLSRHPVATARDHNVQAVSRWNPAALARAISDSDRLVFGGGGLFQDRTSARSLLYYTGLAALARIVGTPVVLCAVGVDPMERWISRLAVRSVLGGNRMAIGVRDSASAAALGEAGLMEGGVGLFADLVFALDVAPPDSGSGVALVARHASAEGERVPAWIAERSRERDLSVRPLAFQPGSDEKTASALAGSPVTCVRFSEAAALIGGSRFVVSARFHALVLAALCGRPFAGIGDKGKIRSLCRQLNMPFIPWTASREEARGAFDRLLTLGPPDTRRVSALKRRADEALDEAFGLL